MTELVTRDAWRAGRLSARPGRTGLVFGRVYEDSAIERRAFSPGGRVFCIASAGSTALDLAREHQVVACDINPAQIAYVRRRLDGGEREIGSAERLLSFLRWLMPLAGWTRNKLEAFLSLDDPGEQQSFFESRLDTRRLRVGLWLCLSPLSLRRVYSPALLSCLPERFDRVLIGRLVRTFSRHPNRENAHARALLLGLDDPTDEARAWAEMRSRIELVEGDAAAYLEGCTPGSFSGLSLSNILDGTESAYQERLLSAVRRAAQPGAMVVRRSFSEPPPDLGFNQAENDRSMLWGVVDVRPVEALRVSDRLSSDRP